MPSAAGPAPDPRDPFFPHQLRTQNERVAESLRIVVPGGITGGGFHYGEPGQHRRLFRITDSDGEGRYSAVPVIHNVTPVPISENDPRGPDEFVDDSLPSLFGPVLSYQATPLCELNSVPNVAIGKVVQAWPSLTSDSWEFDSGVPIETYPYPYGGSYPGGGGGAVSSWLSMLNISCDPATGNQVGDLVEYTQTIFIRGGRPYVAIAMRIVEEDRILLLTKCDEVVSNVAVACVNGTLTVTQTKIKIRSVDCGACP